MLKENNAMSDQTKRFRIAFSFAGEKRDYVAKIAAMLAGHFGEAAILYDKYHEAEFARRDLGFYLPDLYHNESDLLIVVVCRDYERKEWCGLEWDAIFDLLKKRKNEEVMLCRFDHASVKGLYSTAGFVDLDDKTVEQATTLILERLALNEGKQMDHYLVAQRTGFTHIAQKDTKQPASGAFVFDPKKATDQLLSPDPVVAEAALADLIRFGPDCLSQVVPLRLRGHATRHVERRLERLFAAFGQPASAYLTDLIVSQRSDWYDSLLAAMCFPDAVAKTAYGKLEDVLPWSDELSQNPMFGGRLTRSIDVVRVAIIALARTNAANAAPRLRQLAESLLLARSSDREECRSHEYYREKLGHYLVLALILLSDRATQPVEREKALLTLGRITAMHWEPWDEPAYDYDTALRWVSHSLGPRAVDAFLCLAESGYPKARRLAISALGAIRSERSRPVLESSALNAAEEWDTRVRACVALADMGGTTSFRVVRQALAEVDAPYEVLNARNPDLDDREQEARLRLLRHLLDIAAALARLLPWGGLDALPLVNVPDDQIYFGTRHHLVGARAYLGDFDALQRTSVDRDPLVRGMCALALGRQPQRADSISLLKRMRIDAGTEFEEITAEAGLALQSATDGNALHTALVRAMRVGDPAGVVLENTTHEVRREIIDSLVTACGPDDPRTLAWGVHFGLSPTSVHEEVRHLCTLNGR
jgi:hypothetical protein